MLQSSQIGKIFRLPLFLIILTVIYPVFSQETAPVNEELQRLIDRNKLLAEQEKAAKSEAAIATANKDKLAAQFPKPTSAPLAGDTKVDASVKIESEIMAYQALTKNSAAIVKDIKNSSINVKSIAILNQQMIQNLQLYAAVSSQLKLLQKEYEGAVSFPNEIAVERFKKSALPERKIASVTDNKSFSVEVENSSTVTTTASVNPVSAALGGGLSLIGGFVDLLSFFRTDTSVTGSTTTVKESAFVSEMYRAVKNEYKEATFYYPSEFSPKPNGLNKYDVLEKINGLNKLRLNSEFLILVIEEIEKNIKEIETKLGALKARQNKISLESFAVEDEVAALDKINRKYPSAANYEKLELKKLQIKTLLRESSQIPNQIRTLEDSLAENKKKLLESYTYILPTAEMETLSEDSQQLIIFRKKQNIARLKALNTQFGTFYSNLIKPETGGTNPLTALLIGETTRKILCDEDARNPCENAYILALSVVSAGGSNMTKKNLITNVFTGADIKHSGGVVTEYRLYDTDGNIKTAKTFTTYEPYKKAKSITN